MQPNSKFRHIRLLIEKGELSEALTELLILMRQLKSEGIELEDLLEQRKILVLKSEDADLGDRLLQLLTRLFDRFNEADDPYIIEPEPAEKGGSVLSKVLESLGLKKRKSERSPNIRPPHFPKQDRGADEKRNDRKPLPIEEDSLKDVSGLESADKVEEEETGFPPAPPIILPVPEEAQPVHIQAQEDIVNVSVYAPECVERGSSFLLTAFAHLYEQAGEVAQRMQASDPSATLQGAKTLNMPVKRRSSLEFRLTVEDWQIEDSVQVLTWFGIPSSVEFEVPIPADFTKEKVIGNVLIKGASGAIGRVRFNFIVENDAGSPTPNTRFAPTQSQHIQQVFLAYAPENVALVEKHQAEMKERGMEMIDPWKMEGEDWEIKVSDGLVESELFCLFWSQLADDSNEVQISWQMALGHRLGHPERLPDMLPILLEEPAPEAPSELAFLNFIHKKTAHPSIHEDLANHSAAALKSKAEEYLMDGKEEVFTLLNNWFQEDSDMLDEILMQQTQWNTLKKKLRIRLLNPDDAKIDENKIIHACLAIIGQVK